MIKRTEYGYELLENDDKINELTWSMAGGSVRILTDIKTDQGVALLMTRFIKDCQSEERTILPLNRRGQIFFEDNPSYETLLKGIDVAYLKGCLIR